MSEARLRQRGGARQSLMLSCLLTAIGATSAGCGSLGPSTIEFPPDGAVAVPDTTDTQRPSQTAVHPTSAASSAAIPTANGTTNQDADAGPPGPPEVPDVFPDGTPITPDAPGEIPAGCDQADAVRPLLKLSTVQYRNSIRDLLGELGVPEVAPLITDKLQAIPEDSRSLFFSGLDDRISLEHVQGYLNVAKAVASAISEDDERLSTVVGDCALENAPSEACFNNFVDSFGLLTYRRPLTQADRDTLLGFRDDVSGARAQWRALITGALISPRFVNQVEVDGAWESDRDSSLRLSAYEVASRLSYTFWQTMPDAQLFAAAKDGSLLTEAGVERELDRIFADPRTEDTLWAFWREWFGLDNFTGFELGRPGFQAMAEGTGVDEDTYPAMVDELRVLTSHFTFEAPAPLSALLTTNISVTRSSTLAGLYGVDAWSGSGAFPTLDSSQRGGLFQRAALLVSSLEQTNPFHRGAFIKRSLLCENLPPPDPAALPPGSLDIPPTTAVETTRQRFEGKVKDNGLCTGCHGLFSEVGYSLEAFDSLGRFRTVEQVYDEQSGELIASLPIDGEASVSVGGTTETVKSPGDLNQLMIDHGNIGNCLATQYLRFTQRHAIDAASSDRCLADDMGVAAEDEQLGLLGAFRKLASYQAFYRRKVSAQ